MKKKKIMATILLTSIITFSFAGTALAATEYPNGGVWTYGASNGGAFSNYYHGSKYHSSTVVSRRDSRSSKGFAYAGKTSYAWISTGWGEPAAFYYNY